MCDATVTQIEKYLELLETFASQDYFRVAGGVSECTTFEYSEARRVTRPDFRFRTYLTVQSLEP